MDDLIAFVTARLDEDEAAARAAADSTKRAKCTQWTASRDGNGYVVGDASGHFAFCLISGEGAMVHIARHDPARVLREVAAKLDIVRRFTSAPDWTGGEDVRYLAAIWDDHPDYRQEWSLPGSLAARWRDPGNLGAFR